MVLLEMQNNIYLLKYLNLILKTQNNIYLSKYLNLILVDVKEYLSPKVF